MDYPVLIVPGIGNSGPAHWQSVWQAANPAWRRLAVDDWERVECTDWIGALERQLGAHAEDTVVVAHSLGCLAVVHWAARHARAVRGALLVAVPDPTAQAFPRTAATGFAPTPLERLPFPTIVVSSANDFYGSAAYARACATAWGGEFVDVGPKGHLNADSGLGDWREGLDLLGTLGRR